jgi:hypothetical protein
MSQGLERGPVELGQLVQEERAVLGQMRSQSRTKRTTECLDALPLCRYAASMTTKKKVTLYVDEDVMRATRVRAARTDKRDSDVVEEALRSYLGFDVLASVWSRSDLGEDEAMRLAVEETHAARAEKRAARGS